MIIDSNVYPKTEIWFNNDVTIHDCPHCKAKAVVFVMSTGNLLVGCPNSGWDTDCHCRGGNQNINKTIKEWNEDCEQTLRELRNG